MHDTRCRSISHSHPCSGGACFIVFAGKKLQQPIAWRGPFVMTTQVSARSGFCCRELNSSPEGRNSLHHHGVPTRCHPSPPLPSPPSLPSSNFSPLPSISLRLTRHLLEASCAVGRQACCCCAHAQQGSAVSNDVLCSKRYVFWIYDSTSRPPRSRASCSKQLDRLHPQTASWWKGQRGD